MKRRDRGGKGNKLGLGGGLGFNLGQDISTDGGRVWRHRHEEIEGPVPGLLGHTIYDPQDPGTPSTWGFLEESTVLYGYLTAPTAPTDADVTVDLCIDDTTILTLTLPMGSTFSEPTTDAPITVAAGGIWTLEITDAADLQDPLTVIIAVKVVLT